MEADGTRVTEEVVSMHSEDEPFFAASMTSSTYGRPAGDLITSIDGSPVMEFRDPKAEKF